MFVARLSGFLVVLVVIDFGKLRVDHVILRSILGRIALGLLLVHRLAELHRSLRQRIGLGLDRLGIVALQRFLQVADGVFDGAALGLLDLRAMLGQRLLGGMHQAVGMVLGVDRLAALLVLGGVGLGVLDHLLDVGFGQPAGRLDPDLLFLAGRLVLGRHVDDANGIVNVSAKDKATGKEQQIRIQASGGLSDADIQKMVKDAEANAAEDKKRREAVDAKNHADGLVHSTEKALAEHGSKVEESERRAIEDAVSDLKEALKGDDAEAIKAKTNTLAQASMKLGEAMYKQQAESDAAKDAAKDDVVDAEFTEVDDDKNNKKSA